MPYQYHKFCFGTVQELHNFVASECPPVSNGYTVSCQSFADRVDATFTDPVTSISYVQSIVPPQIECLYSLTSASEAVFHMALILVAGYAIRAIIKVMS